MHLQLKPLKDKVIVITGASSGIGLATAYAAAEAGAKLVLSSRNSTELKHIIEKISSKGGKAIFVTADVSNKSELQKVAEEAIKAFGHIDTWVNNAGTSLWGYLQDITEEDMRRLFDINFWGVVNGSLIALKYMKQGGSIINLGSIASDVALPIQGMYSATKHAVKAFTDSLRIELINQKIPVSVTLIKPASIGTPFKDRVKNYTGKAARLISPVYDPSEVVRAILYASEQPIRDIYVGGAAPILNFFSKLMPNAADKIAAKFEVKAQLRNELAVVDGNSLYQSSSLGKIYGNHPEQMIMPCPYTRIKLNNFAKASLIIASVALYYRFKKK